MSREPGELLADRYAILGLIGRGGMGAVWRAHDTGLDRVVAVKELRLPDAIGEDERRELYARMGREARVAARLRHPGIVTVYDRTEAGDGLPLIVMELVDGWSLDDVLRVSGPLPVGRVAAIGRQMLDALTAAHAAGIVHRDVKPANVLLEGDRVVLTDFGIAALDGDATLTASGAILGTPAYMAPEQVRGEPATPRSDLWSLGATLYAATEGRAPFSGPTHGAVFVAIATEEPPPPVNAGPLTGLITGLLRKDPDARLTSDGVRALLTMDAPPQGPREAATLAGPPAAATPPYAEPPARAPHPAGPYGAPPGPPSGPRRGRLGAGWIAGIAAGAVVVLAAAAGITAKVMAGSDTPGPPPPQRTLNAGGADAITDLALSPDGTRLASVSSNGAGWKVKVWNTATGRSAGTLTKDEDSDGSVAFSPDGRTLAVGSEDRQYIELWNVTTRGIPPTLSDPGGDAVTSLAFSPEGRTLTAGVSSQFGEDRFRLWDVAGKRVTGTIRPPHGDDTVSEMDISRDGKTLAFIDDAHVMLRDVRRTSKKTTITSHLDHPAAIDLSPDGKSLAVSGPNGIEIWDVSAKRLVARRALSESTPAEIAFSPDGGRVATRAASNYGILLWDFRNRTSRTFDFGAQGYVDTVAFSRDGRFLAAGTNNGRILLRRLR